jgi:hypothetical protein
MLRSTDIATTKQIAVITTASTSVARKNFKRPKRVLRPKTRSSTGAPFFAQSAQKELSDG